MALEIHDGKVTGSSGVAQAGLTLGIIGTGLAVLQGMNNGNGLGGRLGVSNKNDELAKKFLYSKLDESLGAWSVELNFWIHILANK